jgi:hypothetical protein
MPLRVRFSEGCAPSMGANLWGGSPLWRYRLGLIMSKDNHEPKARAIPRGHVRRKPECKRCEATDRNRIVKAEGCEASWHMTAKPNGTRPTVNAALVHRQFASLPGEICAPGRCGADGHERPWLCRTANDLALRSCCPVSERAKRQRPIRPRSASCSDALRETAEVSRRHSRWSGVGPRRAEQRDTRSRRATLDRIYEPVRVRCGGGLARTEP